MRIRIGKLELKIPWEYLIAPLLVLLALVIMFTWKLDDDQETTIRVMATQSQALSEELPPATISHEEDNYHDASDANDVETKPDDEPQIPSKVNINKAGMDELITLPYIGEVKARAIIEYRMNHGPFNSPEDLLNVKGIGPKTLERFRDHIVFE